MAINLNEAEEQKEFLGAIPPGSMVKVRLNIRQPEAGFVGSDPALTLAKDGNSERLNCEFEVVDGTFKGRKIWENYTVGGVYEGHRKAAQISMRVMRAIREVSRGISPKDTSPAATQGRMLNAWIELQGLEFGIVVDCEKPKSGDRYVNNIIKRIITVDDEQYQHVMAGGEIITDAPIPEIPQTTQSAAPGWAAPKAEPAAPAQGTLPTASAAPKQAWQAPKTAPAAAAPSNLPPPNETIPAGWAAPQQSAGATADVPF